MHAGRAPGTLEAETEKEKRKSEKDMIECDSWSLRGSRVVESDRDPRAPLLVYGVVKSLQSVFVCFVTSIRVTLRLYGIFLSTLQ